MAENIETTDHASGCPGREYTCTCGYDDKRDAEMRRLPAGYTAWLRVIAAERGAKPLSERDAENLGFVVDGIEAQAAQIARLREATIRAVTELDVLRHRMAGQAIPVDIVASLGAIVLGLRQAVEGGL